MPCSTFFIVEVVDRAGHVIGLPPGSGGTTVVLGLGIDSLAPSDYGVNTQFSIFAVPAPFGTAPAPEPMAS